VPRILVTGTSSGLGRALHTAFRGEAFSRRRVDDELRRLRTIEFDAVVHCAADARKEFPASELPAYYDSNLTLTERLLDIPHHLFVYVSSQAVYPSDGRTWREDELLTISGAISIYGVFKLLAEETVRARARRALVLRCSSLVGPEGRQNNIMRVLRREPGRLFLSGDCRYNLLAYSQVEDFILESMRERRDGIFNIGSSDDKTLAEIAGHVGSPAEFGEHRYIAPCADLTKVHEATDIFSLGAFEVADRVVQQIGRLSIR
jgi:nucleoside-diphosphate-sugar epimerase